MLGTTPGPRQRSLRHAGTETGTPPTGSRPPAGDPAPRDAAAPGTAAEQHVLPAQAVIAGHWPVSFYRQERILQLPDQNGTEA